MTDSMKFGPEWLRNLSSEGSTAGAPKYQLAEHRYGREEMLALFDRNVKAPESLVKLQGLYVEKTLMPMALLTLTEEETVCVFILIFNKSYLIIKSNFASCRGNGTEE